MAPKKSSHLYKLLYKIKKPPAGVGPSDVPEGYGATDAILLASILYPADGSLSVLFVGLDGRKGDGEDINGRTQELDDNEWFKVWTMLTKRLGDSETLPAGKKEFCRLVFEQFREILMSVRDREESSEKKET